MRTFSIPPIRETVPIAPEPPEKPVAPHLSYSQLAMYLRCSMQYYFRYIRGLIEKPKVSLSIGKGGHAALEWNTKAKIREGTDKPHEEVIQKASDMMDYYLTEMPPSEYEKDIEPGALKDKFLAATRVHQIQHAPSIQPIGAEVAHDLDINKYLPDSEPEKGTIRPINLHIDLLYKDRDTHLVNHKEGVAVGIEDYKFVTRKKTQTEVDLSPQIAIYSTAIHDLTKKWPTKAGLRLIHPGSLAKNPSKDSIPDSIPIIKSPETMTPTALMRRAVRLAYQFLRAEKGIKAGVFIPTDDPLTCSWCGFRDRCQASLVDDFEAATIRGLTEKP